MTAAKLKYIAAVVLYGTIGLLLRYVSLPSELVVLCRGLIGAASILLLSRLRGHRVRWADVRKNLPALLLSGACLGLNWIFLFAAYRATTVAVASLCNYTAPLMVLVLLALWNRELPTLPRLLCILAAAAGIVLVSGALDGGAPAGGRGVAFGLIAALGFVGVVLCNRNLHDIDAFDRSIFQLLFSAVVILPYVLYSIHGEALAPDLRSIVLVLVLGVVQTGVAYIFYFDGMAKLPVESVAILGYLEPVVAVLISALLLREPITPLGALGAVLILGAAVGNELGQRDSAT